MTKQNENQAMRDWMREFQAIVHAFTRVSGLGRGGLAKQLGYASQSAVTKALDPNEEVSEVFIAKMASTFDDFSECFKQYRAIQSGETPKEVPGVSLKLVDRSREERIELKRAEISQKQKEIGKLYKELDEILDGKEESPETEADGKGSKTG